MLLLLLLLCLLVRELPLQLVGRIVVIHDSDIRPKAFRIASVLELAMWCHSRYVRASI